jgi:hypothetical protein
VILEKSCSETSQQKETTHRSKKKQHMAAKRNNTWQQKDHDMAAKMSPCGSKNVAISRITTYIS